MKAISDEWKDATKSIVAGAGATMVATLGTGAALTFGGMASVATYGVQLLRNDISPSSIVVDGAITGFAIGGACWWGAIKLFKKAPSRWLAGLGVAATLGGQMLLPDTPTPATTPVQTAHLTQRLDLLDVSRSLTSLASLRAVSIQSSGKMAENVLSNNRQKQAR